MSVATPSKNTLDVLTIPHVTMALEALPQLEELTDLAADVHTTSTKLEEIQEQIVKARDLLGRVDITTKFSASEQAAISRAQLAERNAGVAIATPAAEAFTALHKWTAAMSVELERVANGETDQINGRRPELDKYLRREAGSLDRDSAAEARSEYKRLAGLNAPHAEIRQRAIYAHGLIQATFNRVTGCEWQAGRNSTHECARFVARQTRWAKAQAQAQAA